VSRRPPGDPQTLRADRGAPLTVVDCTTGPPVPYRVAWDWQRDLVERRADGTIGDTVLLLEHPATHTLGRQADRANVLLDDEQLAARGIELVEVDRGGDVTHHGPGQLVGYPVLRLDGPRVVDHVRALEEVNLRVLAGYGLEGERVDGFTGVWVGTTKVTAIGVRVGRAWTTQHGWATNVHTDMDDFATIVACGITDPDRTVGSLATLGVTASVPDVATATVAAIGGTYGCTVRVVGPSDLGLLQPAPSG
jgi:lipoate-protein ligase B